MVWGVAALLTALSDALQARFPVITVQGELSGFTRAASGHCYFSLKDAEGQPAMLRCAMFRRAASMVDFAPRDGMTVELRGRLDLYGPRGELQFIVEAMMAGYVHAEIAEALDRSVGAVRARMPKIRKKLEPALEDLRSA